jgi:hypothetical protein
LNGPGFENVRPLISSLCATLPGALVAGEMPGGALERLVLAKLCYERGFLARAADLFRGAFELYPKLARVDWGFARWEAAGAAAQAGCGLSQDAAGLDEERRSALRRQALEWFRADLARSAEICAGSDPTACGRIRMALVYLGLRDMKLSCVQEDGSLALLPPPERGAWKAFWEELRQLVRRLNEAEPGRRRVGLAVPVDSLPVQVSSDGRAPSARRFNRAP